ncbi:MAG: phosphoglucomutase (alpha-D-glucose-1,6-bisphosphate-dependent) [Syntrophales bacterium]|jgi:phosphoglucomutase|nr:phosphoglucomutase (alpha-D-glucose-1,6-bisphosphate-dependent) [Syntrophales bacterium]
MNPHKLAGKPVPRDFLTNIPRLITAYYTQKPDPLEPAQRVSFGTSGHRGSSFKNSFNEMHILAISQAICNYRKSKNIDGPFFMGMDTHALSEPAMATAIEVFIANGVECIIQQGLRYTPTPVISHAILTYNGKRRSGYADGIVITPSHNPPEDGGFKYNPPHGGPADTGTTGLIEKMANDFMEEDCVHVRRIPLEKAIKSKRFHEYDYINPYVRDLAHVIDLDVIARAGLKIGIDPLGGAAMDFWDPIADRYGIALEVVNRIIDPTFSFMTLDKDGKIRMDCSSAFAMQNLIKMKDHFDIACGNDTDADRHGIVTRGGGLMNANHYLVVAVHYLFQNRPGWNNEATVGKTLVSTSMIDRIAADLGRRLWEVPVGFKWFVGGLLDGTCGFGGEESAGASFLRKNGTVWTTDKDGIIMNLLACEIMARTEKDPAMIYQNLIERFGRPSYNRMDVPATPAQKEIIGNLSPDKIEAREMAGEKITAILTKASGNDADIGGLKVISPNGWFAVRPSGTEDIYKIYAESFLDAKHRELIEEEAVAILNNAFRNTGG